MKYEFIRGFMTNQDWLANMQQQSVVLTALKRIPANVIKTTIVK